MTRAAAAKPDTASNEKDELKSLPMPELFARLKSRSWDRYTAAYEDALSRCSTEHAPWFVIPSDHKWFRNLAVARIVVEYLEGLDLKYPRPSVDLEHVRREYHAATKR